MPESEKTFSETLFIRTFGEITIKVGAHTHPVSFEARTAQALLVYLACHQRPLGRDALAEMFWPERTQEQSRANLRVAIHRVRQQLDPYLLVTRQSVALNPNADVILDVAQFEAHLAAGQLVAATALYVNGFLDGFYLDGSPAFEQWVLLEQERFRILALAAYQQLIAQLADEGQVDAAITNALRLLKLDPYHEPTHRQLMRLLVRADQRNAALAQYETCRHLLAAELDIPPDVTTTALYEQIVANEFGVTMSDRELSAQPASTVNPTHKSANLRLHNLPARPTPFIGRAAELAQTVNLLANPDCRLVTLLGVGGIGKTRLAIEAATCLEGRFTGGICFVSLASVGTPELVLVAIAQSLGLDTTRSDLLAQVADYLYPREVLLVLDNFDHLLDAAETVAYVLHSAPRTKAVVTSRQRLGLLEEWLMPITGLSVAGGSASESGQLFLRSAQRVRPGFEANGQEEAIAAVCQQAEGMPLAIELAASWVRMLSCNEIARQMRESLNFLTTELRNLPERHRSIYALFTQSWQLLSSDEQRILRRVSVFQGGWTLDEATQILDADTTCWSEVSNLPPTNSNRSTRKHLLSLVDKSLVSVNDQNRFEMHELVRQYAAEQLAASGEVNLIRQQHFKIYLQLARTADRKVRGPEAAAWFARLEADQDNLRAAWKWTLDTDRFIDAAWLGVALCHTWHIRAHWYEVAQQMEQLLPHRHSFAPDLRLAVLLTLIRFWRALHNFRAIEQYVAEVMQLQELSDMKLLRAATWFYVANASPDGAQASAAFEKSIALLIESEASPRLGSEFCFFADRFNLLAMTFFRYAIRLTDDMGEYARAELYATQSLNVFKEQGNRDMIAYAIGSLGRLALLRSDLVLAQKLLHEAVDIVAAVGNLIGLGDWQPKLGILTFHRGDATTARRVLLESLDLWLNLQNHDFLARIYGYLAEVALGEGELDQAAQWLSESLSYQTELRWLTPEFVDCLWVGARLAAARQQYERAATLFGLAEQVRRRIHYELHGPSHPPIETTLATLRAVLGAEAFADAFAAGEHLSLGNAFATILVPAHIKSIVAES